MLSRIRRLIAAPLFFVLLSSAFAVAAAAESPDETTDEVVALNNQGVEYFKSHQYVAAIEVLKKAIQLLPDLSRTHYNLGCVYQAEGDFPPALDAFKEALRLDPTSIDVLHQLGLTS